MIQLMIQVPERRSKLSPKFEGPCLVLQRLHGNKFEVFEPKSNKVEVVHNDRLKRTNSKVNVSLAEAMSLARAVRPASPVHTHNYDLRSRDKCA